MTGMLRREQSRSFGKVVVDYERGRPSYPTDAVQWLVDGARRVVDLGAGTGKFTASLVGAGREIVAVEPQEQMAKQLNGAIVGAFAVCAGAEALPIRGGWADVVVVAQAFHWFDQERSLPEIARVLSPGGRLSLVWNVRDKSVDWVAELSRIAGQDNSAATRASLDASPYFAPFESRRFRMVQVLDRDSLIAHVRSRSMVASLPESERADVVERVMHLWDTHPDLRGRDLIELPYVTEVYRAGVR
jgi:SAM-dependent methyltransferase